MERMIRVVQGLVSAFFFIWYSGSHQVAQLASEVQDTVSSVDLTALYLISETPSLLMYYEIKTQHQRTGPLNPRNL